MPAYGAIERTESAMNSDDERGLLLEDDQSSGISTPLEGGVQEGVQKIEAINLTWTTRSLIVAYVRWVWPISLQNQKADPLVKYIPHGILYLSGRTNGHFAGGICDECVQQTLQDCHCLRGPECGEWYAGSYSSIGLFLTLLAVIKPPMAKIADAFGRLEAFCVSILIYILGYIQMAASTNVESYVSAQIFYSAGSTGLQILQQVFIADSSDLLNRAFFALLPEFPFLVTVWLGPTLADAVLRTTSWRWGYAMWAIILPASFLPLALSLLLNQRKAQRLHLIRPSKPKRRSLAHTLKRTWYELDVGGLILISAGVALILIPLTLAANAKNGWKSTSIIVMIVVGVVCLAAVPFWETSKKLAPKPVLSFHLLGQRTVLAGCALAFWYFSTVFFSLSYLVGH